MSETIIRYGLELLVTGILVPLVGFALRAAAKKIEESDKENRTRAALARLMVKASLAVADVEATLRPALKAATGDGKITPEEGKQLRDAAISRLKLLAEKEIGDLLSLGVLTDPAVDTFAGAAVEKVNLEIPTGSLARARFAKPEAGTVARHRLFDPSDVPSF